MKGILIVGHGSTSQPYLDGVETLAKALQQEMPSHTIKIAYNEFCSPTIEETLAEFEKEGCSAITAFPTMIISGGSHSEKDIPEKLEAAKKQFSSLSITYAWPFDPKLMAHFFHSHIKNS